MPEPDDTNPSAIKQWRETPTRPVTDFGLTIVMIDGRPHWSPDDPLNEYDLRFLGDVDFGLPAGADRSSREYLLANAAWGVGPLLRHVRMKCGECMGGPRGSLPRGGVAQAVEECSSVACSLWPFRLGFDPRREEISEEEREVRRERALAHGFGSRPGTIPGEQREERGGTGRGHQTAGDGPDDV